MCCFRGVLAAPSPEEDVLRNLRHVGGRGGGAPGVLVSNPPLRTQPGINPHGNKPGNPLRKKPGNHFVSGTAGNNPLSSQIANPSVGKKPGNPLGVQLPKGGKKSVDG